MYPYVGFLKTINERIRQTANDHDGRQMLLEEIRRKQSEVEIIKGRIYEIIETVPYRSQEDSIELNINLQNCRTFIRICEDFIRDYFPSNGFEQNI